jgi:hypothetical protein
MVIVPLAVNGELATVKPVLPPESPMLEIGGVE